MKKIACLLFISAFALTGCAKEVTPEEADGIANEIKSYRVDTDSVSEFKLKYKSSYHLSGTTNRELSNEKIDISQTYEFSTRFNYIHIYSSESREDKVEESSNTYESEQWYYMKNKVLYKANRTKTKGNEIKKYEKTEKYSEAIKDFSNLFDSLLPSAFEEARGEEFLSTESFDRFLGEDYKEGMTYAAKFYSSGSGNFRIVGAAKLDQEKDGNLTAKGVGTLSCKWNHYVLKNASLALTITSSDGTNKNDMKLNVAFSKKVSTLIIPTYPKLSNFAEVNFN